ncbi:MAG: sulfotransferase [Parachlamydiaceae bacterium]|nr:sulfotransferase [Parachlamydiaceae bacterium]
MINCMVSFIPSYALIFFLLFFIQPIEAKQGKIVYLISMPRSCSTVCMRMMEASEEFLVMNEPAIYPFILNNKVDRDLTEGWFHESSHENFDIMKQHILNLATDSNVFVKEICFFVEDFLLHDSEFVSNPDIQFVFLIRNPHNSIISYYKKYLEIVPNFSYYIGCQSSYNIYQAIKNKAKNPIIIISAEDLCNRPKETAQQLFTSLSIPFHDKCLQWPDLGDKFSGIAEWNEVKVREKLYHWHDHAIHSTCFEPITENRIDAEGNPTFEEISKDSDRLECIEMYLENQPFYQLLLKAVEGLWQPLIYLGKTALSTHFRG